MTPAVQLVYRTSVSLCKLAFSTNTRVTRAITIMRKRVLIDVSR